MTSVDHIEVELDSGFQVVGKGRESQTIDAVSYILRNIVVYDGMQRAGKGTYITVVIGTLTRSIRQHRQRHKRVVFTRSEINTVGNQRCIIYTGGNGHTVRGK